jgi:hypothetical protein
MLSNWTLVLTMESTVEHNAHTFKMLIQPGYPGFLDLPWHLPLATWPDETFVQVKRGLSRHIVRFVNYDGRLYALKELPRRHAEREYRLLLQLASAGLHAVKVVGVIVDRGTHDTGEELDAILITRHLEFSLPYRSLFQSPDISDMHDNLLNALAQLLVQLHLIGFFWGDCSLSNTLFRRDAGTLAAYLVDSETSELHPTISDRMRRWELEIAAENIAGEIWDLQEGYGELAGLDPFITGEELTRRYERLWSELNQEELLEPNQQFRIDERVHRLNALGFDIKELEILTTASGDRLRLIPHLVEPGHHRRRLLALTGLDVQENQARRLLNSVARFRAKIEQREGRELPETVAAYRWLTEIYQPTIDAVSTELRDKLDPPEVFHQVLDHRWYLSEAAGMDVGLETAVRSYIDTVLRYIPDQRTVLPEGDEDEMLTRDSA